MSAAPLAILKFGSSVLPAIERLPIAVGEIYRFLRRGYRVVAVVSAFGDTTDRLLAQARRHDPEPDGHALAALAATGEATTVAWLALALRRCGIRCRTFDAAGLGIVTRHDALDAEPVGFVPLGLREALALGDVAVVPGFVARDEIGRPTVLGRGGSDLTAVFLAKSLGAAVCRLLKDTEGIFERDPHAPARRSADRPESDPPVRRLTLASYRDARRLGGGVVQAKALAFAESQGVVLEVARAGSRRTTWIGVGRTRVEVAEAAAEPLRVLLLGHGAVGRALRQRLAADPDRFRVVGVLVRDEARHASLHGAEVPFSSDHAGLTDIDADVVVEALGGIDPARRLVAAALRSGRDVVTANKELMARHGVELRGLAAKSERLLLHSAAVGGVAPILEAVERIAREAGITGVRGLLNATSSFVLQRVGAGLDLEAATAEARARGLCEASVDDDLSGIDAARKAVLIVRAAFGIDIRPESVEVQGLSAVQIADRGGSRWRLVTTVERVLGGVRVVVAPEPLGAADPLGDLCDAECGVVIETAAGGRESARGAGAGGPPTAESLTADLMDVWRQRRQASAPEAAAIERAAEPAS